MNTASLAVSHYPSLPPSLPHLLRPALSRCRLFAIVKVSAQKALICTYAVGNGTSGEEGSRSGVFTAAQTPPLPTATLHKMSKGRCVIKLEDGGGTRKVSAAESCSFSAAVKPECTQAGALIFGEQDDASPLRNRPLRSASSSPRRRERFCTPGNEPPPDRPSNAVLCCRCVRGPAPDGFPPRDGRSSSSRRG